MTRRGGKMKLLNLTQKITDILHVTQLITVFDVYDNEADALASFKRLRTSPSVRRPAAPGRPTGARARSGASPAGGWC